MVHITQILRKMLQKIDRRYEIFLEIEKTTVHLYFLLFLIRQKIEDGPKMKKKITDIYFRMRTLVSKNDEDGWKALNERYDCFQKKLNKYQSELSKDDYPIIVAGTHIVFLFC